ncbi:sortase [uncultured Microbacterium sp.]|uniref:sortase n=1 Tax=uncultured Microbacterium sp. TaxID=191216 RepID=UPI0025D3D65C|nr:sortase [uncultured Microbacterium sp.]
MSVIEDARTAPANPTGVLAPPRPPRGRPPRRPGGPHRVSLPAPTEPLSTRGALARGALALIVTVLVMFLIDLLAFSPLQHFAAQQQLRDQFREQLAAGTAPVSEGDFDDVLLPDGAPVALLSIPSLGVDEVIVEGTSSGDLANGPGHRRDTVLPGQVGVSVIMGRAAAYGGPFTRLQALQPGDRFQVRTGQGLSTFEVMGLRYAGDASPPAPARGESRVILMTARGIPFVPTGVAYVDAKLVGDAQPAGIRQTTPLTLPATHAAMATDTSTVWALVFALQFLVLAEIAAVWSFRRVGAQRTWIVFTPVLLLANLFVAEQTIRLLPNLL